MHTNDPSEADSRGRLRDFVGVRLGGLRRPVAPTPSPFRGNVPPYDKTVFPLVPIRSPQMPVMSDFYNSELYNSDITCRTPPSLSCKAVPTSASWEQWTQKPSCFWIVGVRYSATLSVSMAISIVAIPSGVPGAPSTMCLQHRSCA